MIIIRIGICFPIKDYEKLELNELKKYLEQFIEAGITSFDFYTELFLEINEKLIKLVNFLNDNDIKITFHYYSTNNIDIIKNESDYQKLLDNYKKELFAVRQTLNKLNVYYQTTVVFHGLDYLGEFDKYNHEMNLIKIFKVLCEYTQPLKFEILIESLSFNHPIGNHIGDDISELKDFVNNIDNDNFGVCWDIGHTRLNSIEENKNILLPNNMVNKVRFTHIHNIYKKNEKDDYYDHLPLTNLNYQKEELKFLVNNNYQGVYSIEFATEDLEENILIYLNSVKLLKEILKKLKEEYNGKNS